MSKTIRRKYYAKRIEGMRTSNLRNWWRSVKLVTGLKTIEPPLSGLANQILDGDMHALANSVNACFQSVAADLSPLDNKDLPLPPDILPSDFSVSINDVERKLSQINIHKVPGPDGLPNWIAYCAISLLSSLVHLVSFLMDLCTKDLSRPVKEGSERNPGT